MFYHAIASVVFLAASVVASELPPQRPMDALQGDCSNYGWNLKREFEVWGTQPIAVVAKPEPSALPLVDIDRRLDVTLQPHASVKFAVSPEKDRGGPNKFSGLISFVPPADGVYRVSAASGVWLDAVVSGAIVPSLRFEMQTKCTTIFKSIAYELKGGAPVTLQINGSAKPVLGLLISPWSK